MKKQLKQISIYKEIDSLLCPDSTDLLELLKDKFFTNSNIFSQDCKIEFYELVKEYVDLMYEDYNELTDGLTKDLIVSKFQAVMNLYKHNNFEDYEWIVYDDIIMSTIIESSESSD